MPRTRGALFLYIDINNFYQYYFASFWDTLSLQVPHQFCLREEEQVPYVTVVFDFRVIPQETVDKFKPWLQNEVARILSSKVTLASDDHLRTDITTSPKEIFVTQYEVHPTDVNFAPFEIYIQAGRPKGRSGDKIAKLLAKAVSETGWIHNDFLGDGKSCIFIVFHENNGFGFIPKRK